MGRSWTLASSRACCWRHRRVGPCACSTPCHCIGAYLRMPVGARCFSARPGARTSAGCTRLGRVSRSSPAYRCVLPRSGVSRHLACSLCGFCRVGRCARGHIGPGRPLALSTHSIKRATTGCYWMERLWIARYPAGSVQRSASISARPRTRHVLLLIADGLAALVYRSPGAGYARGAFLLGGRAIRNRGTTGIITTPRPWSVWWQPREGLASGPQSLEVL